uniref:Uncharacterized protein n=1 Tax=Pyrodinium bahamense TaxID=73915 RepID=A0A7S0FPR0_9DINO|mmetsp:Transcript_40885/g.113679  ORF Transcript_40885/g.113679 Transcript_40885/m.113679 type:complete len:190 (+) Transcript_40885:38-607(+)
MVATGGSLLLVLASLHWIVRARYGKPPCELGETYAALFGRVLCTTECDDQGACPGDKPEGTFADPRCVIEVEDGTDNGGQGKKANPTYCGLVCTSNSYCPPGGRCTKGRAGSLVTKDEDNALGMPVAPEDFKGVCTFKAKSRRSKKSSPPKEMRLSSVLAEGVLGDLRERMGIDKMPLPDLHDKLMPEL